MRPYDVKRELNALYAPKNTEWALVEVPEQQFLAIDGHGDPNTSPDYARAVEALYAVAYTLKFAVKRGGGREFVVAPLEGLWWADDYAAFTRRDKDSWHWTMLISQPPWVGADLVDAARDTALEKKKLPAIGGIRLRALREGRSAQVLHVGSYDDEGPVLAGLGAFFAGHGLRHGGLHHEIYLSDPRRTEAARLKTVLRQPAEPAS
ncbi:GyrI-like domain-containing protein [Amycolatopsis endophytica]|uniref:GyrI-like small molecule binding domain-containing protein n=1 Tax=Amycolatopsis endophytica TaxID=860233 RepID=A0A853BC17_9PSEU|nr:GyrI-like domain-containing protein [Amycolatopsis endophytica]NYI91916.1 hypothetical protein [Amycolatopsis endophytica]